MKGLRAHYPATPFQWTRLVGDRRTSNRITLEMAGLDQADRAWAWEIEVRLSLNEYGHLVFTVMRAVKFKPCHDKALANAFETGDENIYEGVQRQAVSWLAEQGLMTDG